MNYHAILKDNMLNGEGLRVVIFLSGCAHNCFNCHNVETHNPTSGYKFNKLAKEKLFEELRKDYISGITFSGGDPLFPDSIEEVSKLIKEIKKKFKDKTIWLYTGYLYEEVKDLEIIKEMLVDVLIDGKYVDKLHNPKLYYVGSSNQRIIDVKKSILENKVVLYIDNYEK